jgi:hypothetical protein
VGIGTKDRQVALGSGASAGGSTLGGGMAPSAGGTDDYGSYTPTTLAQHMGQSAAGLSSTTPTSSPARAVGGILGELLASQASRPKVVIVPVVLGRRLLLGQDGG